MTYEYGSKVAWLEDLHGNPSPHDYDLCPNHADRLSVPQGWERRDRRSSAVRLLFAGVA
jgi:hypothetical protein